MKKLTKTETARERRHRAEIRKAQEEWFERGKQKGRRELQAEFRKLFDVESRDYYSSLWRMP